jgi:hypothetical protein
MIAHAYKVLIQDSVFEDNSGYPTYESYIGDQITFYQVLMLKNSITLKNVTLSNNNGPPDHPEKETKGLGSTQPLLALCPLDLHHYSTYADRTSEYSLDSYISGFSKFHNNTNFGNITISDCSFSEHEVLDADAYDPDYDEYVLSLFGPYAKDPLSFSPLLRYFIQAEAQFYFERIKYDEVSAIRNARYQAM